MSVYRGIDGEQLFTAADLKAAKLETVEECIRIATKTLRGGTTTDPPYDAGIWDVIESSEKLKEEINASKG